MGKNRSSAKKKKASPVSKGKNEPKDDVEETDVLSPRNKIRKEDKKDGNDRKAKSPSKSSSKKKKKDMASKGKADDGDDKRRIVTMEALEEVSTSSSENDWEVPPEEEWNEEARALQRAIQQGVFDDLVRDADSKKKKDKKNQDGRGDDDDDVEEDESDDESIEVVVLLEDEEEEEEEEEPPRKEEKNNAKKGEVDGSSDEGESESESEGDGGDNKRKALSASKKKEISKAEEQEESASDEEQEGSDEEKPDDNSDSEKGEDSRDDDDEDDDDEERETSKDPVDIVRSKALHIVTREMLSARRGIPWAETFDVIPSKSLPFGTKPSKHRDKDEDDDDDDEEEVVDIHDDLKREVAFYDVALQAVHDARRKCVDAGIPFSRPDDFFAEMVKTDDHMAKVKDRLIFETKKIEAVAQRKANKEQKLRSKEAKANKLAEKAKRKRDHMQAVEEWAQSAAAKRGRGMLGGDDDDGGGFLNNDGGRGKSKKRTNADKRYGFGGKRGRFKQNTQAEINDMSKFNPRGNFSGGMKNTRKGPGGSGAQRRGKRARDAMRASRR